MNEQGAANALEAAAQGDKDKLGPLSAWLAGHEELGGRYLASDLLAVLRQTAAAHAISDRTPREELESLVEELAGRGDSLLAAVFDSPAASQVLKTDGAIIGSARSVAAELGAALPAGLLEADPDDLAIVVSHPAQGRLGAVRAAAWLQTVLGAIGLAAYATTKNLCPVAVCPTLARASYTGAGGAGLTTIEAATRFPTDGTAAHLEQLFADESSVGLIADASARFPEDLVQARLTRAARWLQAASSAVSTADAFVSLGVALETVTGDRKSSAVIERVTKRAATFIASGEPDEERDDIYYDQLRRAKRFYDLRSRATHGQYDDRTADQGKGDADRRDFHSFVADVCLGFRRHARERQMLDEEHFDRWWSRVEIKGVFA